ncbi:hypothetical protein CLF_113340 [Clonorchis sinensis]|uniref:Integrase catalytic domain-containing protein n=1 Tax=Clonorchis sinensis TaxID=79923 RepID=G7YXU2_CLOSI|nr:hypothetical protein CLF_113180 [Clonorchis sinensis]GAA57910.1 hypothetical protein CLF_113340 [Clonorchis sinensis]
MSELFPMHNFPEVSQPTVTAALATVGKTMVAHLCGFCQTIWRQSFLIVVDALSKWSDVFVMSETTTMATVTKLRHLFSIFGIPEITVFDNDTQFTSHQFGEFFRRLCITLVTSSPQSTGEAGRLVDTFKRVLSKAK